MAGYNRPVAVMDTSLNIRIAQNGIILRYDDPELVKKAEDSEEYVDTSVESVFNDADTAMAEATKVLKTLMGMDTSGDDFDSAFKEATNNE